MTLYVFLLTILLVCLYILWRYNIKKLQTYISPLQGSVVVWEKYNKEKLLTINSYSQGISIADSSIKKSYWYKIARRVLEVCKKKKNPHVLVLGLGANTTSLLIQKENPKVFFTIVEIDKQIIQVCKDWFNLASLKNLTLINDDAYKVISRKTQIRGPFDAIIIDIFNGKSGRRIHSREEKIITQLTKLLHPHGVLVFNWPANSEKTKKEADEIMNNCKKIGLYVSKEYVQDTRRYKNFVIAAYFEDFFERSFSDG